MVKTLTEPPTVKLVKTFAHPLANVVATARTCYSAKGIVEEAPLTARDEEFARDLYRSGHHTTFQHATFQFALERVSRQCVWSFLHSHPFYNSEQVSQRYVTVKPDKYFVPEMPQPALELYTDSIARQMEAYHQLLALLQPVVEKAYTQRYSAKALVQPRLERAIQRKAMEIARYVLPVATYTALYHTISGVTLLRYRRLCRQYDAPTEQCALVEAMFEAVRREDPGFAAIGEDPLPLESTPEAQFFQAHPTCWTKAFREEFDASLQGTTSKLVSNASENEHLLSCSVREVLGLPSAQLTDEEAIELVLNPARNCLLGETLNLTTVSKLSRALVHPHYTFRKKISHSADSQDQRHRMTPASRPCLHAQLDDEPDYIIPALIRQVPKALAIYRKTMIQAWTAMERLKTAGVCAEFAMYLLPNAAALRFTESSDLLNLRHKHLMRLCYNAQEEIWRASLDEALQIRQVNPRIGKYLLPPCAQRALAKCKLICPEGARCCGAQVWKLNPEEYARVI